MSGKNDIEFKQMMGERQRDSDGFTYEYGRVKGGYYCRQRYKNVINRGRRAHKRSVKFRALRRVMSEFSE